MLPLPRWTLLGRIVVLNGAILLSFFSNGQLHASGPGASPDTFEVRPAEGSWQPNSVTAIVQTKDGYLWLGTYHGLVRFDGVSYTVFDSGNTADLPNGRITSLFESNDHVLWIGHETGHVTRKVRGRFHPVNLNTNWPGGVVESITADQAGDIWLLNDSGLLFRVRDGRIESTPGGASPIRKATLSEAKDGKLWITSNGKIAILQQGGILPFTFPEDDPNIYYERIFAARDGGVWVLGNGRLRKWRDGTWVDQIEGFPSSPGSVSLIAEMESGILAGTMQDGLWMLRHGAEPLHFSRTNGLSHDWIRALLIDQEGNCWIGTGAGFDGLRQRKVRMISPPDGWQGCAVRSFVVHSDESAWIGTEGAGLYRYDHGQWSVFGRNAGIYGLFIWSVLESKNELFVGTWGAGLFQRKGDRFESAGDFGNIKAPVTALYEGHDGEIWIGTQEGLHRFENGKHVWFAGKNKLRLPDVRTITESNDKTLWVGMYGGGLAAVRDGLVTQFCHKDGLGSDLVSCLYAEPNGVLWIGTADNGLTRFMDGKFSTISDAQGLPSKVISHIVDDRVGHLWIGSQTGILRVSKADLERCANQELNTLHCLTYGRSEGLASQTCSGGFQPGACRTPDGRLWFPTTKGIAVLDPANVSSNSVPPPVVIESLFVDGSTTNLLDETIASTDNFSELAATEATAAFHPEISSAGASILRIPPGHQRFEFHFTGLSFAAPDKVRFRHTLDGLEHKWVEAGIKRVAEYTFLPPGTYTFRATACNNDEVWNPVGTAITFTVLPYFWQTFVFRISSMIAGAGALAGTIFWAARLRLRRKLDQLERQRALERERARIARDIHDDLGSSLTKITMLSQSVRAEIEAQPEAAQEVDQIYSTAREITRAMDEIVWAVNPKYDTLDSLAAYVGRFAQQYLSAAGIRCRLHMPVQLPALALSAEVRHNVFLAFKEALNNIVKHARATEVSVTLNHDSHHFVLLLVDNGQGVSSRNSAQVEPSLDSLRSSSGNGLLNMQKRMQEIGGSCEWESTPGKGTRVTLNTPFHHDITR